MPTVGAVDSNDPRVYGQPLNHDNEQATAGYYRLGLANGVTAELTATSRTGWQRYRFPPTAEANVVFNTAEVRGDEGNSLASAISIVGDDRVEGSVTDNRFCKGTPEHTLYFSASFSRPFASFGTWSDSSFTPGGRDAGGAGARGGWVRFDTSSDQDVTVKVGVSYTGIAGARTNLAAETDGYRFDFDQVREDARNT
jgi:putative alpha-1,2-mannosidase